MTTRAATPVIAVSKRDEDMELINGLLRNAGMPVACRRVADLDDLPEALGSARPHLLFVFPSTLAGDLGTVTRICAENMPMLPVIAVTDDADEAEITTAMGAGARDLVSRSQPRRLIAVANRELRAFRLEHSLRETIVSANRYRRELKAVMAGSVEAICYVQEGIVVNANPAWAELFGLGRAEMVTNMPLMDLFDRGSHSVLKGALMACTRGQWTTELLRVEAVDKDGAAVAVELRIERGEYGDEPATRLSIPQEAPSRNEPEQLVVNAVHKDPMTGFYHRRQFVDLLAERLATSPGGGVRALAYIRPDKFGDIKDEVGPLATEDVLIQLAEVIRGLTQPNDVCGRFGGVVFTILLERGTLRDLEAWAENVVRLIADHIFEIHAKTLSLTCTLGLSEVTIGTDRVESLLIDAENANKRGRQRGGDQVVVAEISDESTRIRRFDTLWVERIRTALLEHRFRLIQLPIASLHGNRETLHDSILRMVDEQGDDVAAAEFIAAAERNNLVKALDRWVIGEALEICRTQDPGCLFVRLSKDSITDSALSEWLASHTKLREIDPSKICFQFTEEHAAHYTKPLRLLISQLHKLGFGAAIEHFGVSKAAQKLLEQLPVQYVKVDGSLLQNIASNPAQQEHIEALIAAASKRNIKSIAERVEQASTMAVLFQLGIDYMQGHYVHEPEVVLG